MKTLGIGMVGARYGARMHLANYAKLSRESSRCAASARGRRKAPPRWRGKRRLPFVTDDFAALLARKDIDAVDICAPPALHHEFAIRAADAGKHIIMEKPLTGYFGAPGDPEPIGTPCAARPDARGRAQKRRGGARSGAAERREVLLRGKLDLRAADRKDAAADRGVQGFDP
jgi:hypothetical protein